MVGRKTLDLTMRVQLLPWQPFFKHSPTREQMDNLDNDYTFFINDKKVSYFQWMNSREDGYYQSFYENGQLRCEGDVINTKWNGTFKYFTESGKLKRFNTWVNGVLHGVEKEYKDDGSLQYELIYVNGTYRPELKGEENRLARLVIFGYDIL